MTTYPTHHQQMTAYENEPCANPSCGARRVDHQRDIDDEGRPYFGMCRLTNCEEFQDAAFGEGSEGAADWESNDLRTGEPSRG